MGVVEQTPEFLVGFELGLLMGRRLVHVIEFLVVDQGREQAHGGVWAADDVPNDFHPINPPAFPRSGPFSRPSGQTLPEPEPDQPARP